MKRDTVLPTFSSEVRILPINSQFLQQLPSIRGVSQQVSGQKNNSLVLLSPNTVLILGVNKELVPHEHLIFVDKTNLTQYLYLLFQDKVLMQVRMAQNSRFFCLSLFSAKITSIFYNVQFFPIQFYYLCMYAKDNFGESVFSFPHGVPKTEPIVRFAKQVLFPTEPSCYPYFKTSKNNHQQ